MSPKARDKGCGNLEKPENGRFCEPLSTTGGAAIGSGAAGKAGGAQKVAGAETANPEGSMGWVLVVLGIGAGNCTVP